MRKGISFGCFDLTHAGHFDLFAQAKRYCDHLTVAVAHDTLVRAFKGHGRPIVALEYRLAMVKGCRYVDAVCVYGDAHAHQKNNAQHQINILARVKPDVLIEGADSHILPDILEQQNILRIKTKRLDAEDVCTRTYLQKIEQLTHAADRDVSKYYFPHGGIPWTQES